MAESLDTFTSTWHELRTGDWILCPQSGQVERVVFVNPNHAAGTVHVRTSEHDHPNRSAGGAVEVIVESPS
jgi:hypothetical protein